jgi:Flp pilus assembly protein TadD
VIGIVAVGDAARADRYTYFPLIGLFLVIAWSIPVMRARAARTGVAIAAGAVLAVLCVQTSRQLRHWRNSQTLFEHTLAVAGPQRTILVGYGLALAERGDFQAAERQYRAAIDIWPDSPVPLMNLGALMLQEKRFGPAEECFRRALHIAPNYAEGRFNLAIALAQQGDLAGAERELRQALQLRPDLSNAREALAEVRRLQGKP